MEKQIISGCIGGWTVHRQNSNGFWEDMGTWYGDKVGAAGHLIFSTREKAEAFISARS